jgi:LAGLIDADG-like domain
MDNETLAYLAGLFDGEGSIFILRKVRNGRNYYWMEISITNTDKGLIDWIQSVVGGRKSLQPETYTANGKPIFRWRASSIQASSFLQMVMPWLRIKRDRAEIAISFQEALSAKAKHAVPDNDHLAALQRYRDSLMSLNKRGASKEVDIE